MFDLYKVRSRIRSGLKVLMKGVNPPLPPDNLVLGDNLYAAVSPGPCEGMWVTKTSGVLEPPEVVGSKGSSLQ